MAKVRSDKVQIEIEINGEPVKRTLADMEKAYKKLRGEIKHLEEGSDAFNKKAAEIKQLEEELKRTRRAARGLGEEQESLGKKVLAGASQLASKFSSLPGIFGKVGGALGGVITKLLGPLGLVIGAITGMVAGAKELYAIASAFEKSREEVSKFTNLTGEALSVVNAQITAISRTFDQDFNEVLRTGSANSKAFGSDMIETLDLIEKGLIATGHQGDAFLDQIKEYGPVLKQAGLDQAEAYAVIASGIVEGAFQDKIPDAIKEFNIRIKDLSQGQRDVLERNLGVDFTNKIVNGIKTGEKTSIEALNEIGGKLGDLGADSSETQAIISNLFGGPGEDVGADFIIGLQNIKGSMDEVIDSSNVYVQRQIEQLRLEKQLTAAKEELSMSLDGVGNWFSVITKQVKIFFMEGIANAATSVRHFIDNFKIFRVQVTESINVVLRALSNLVNNMIDAVNLVNKLVGIKEIENIDLTIGVEVSSADLQKQLREKIAAEREAFAAEQKRKELLEEQKKEEALRLAKLRERKKTLDAEKNLTTKELQKQAELYAKAEMEIAKMQVDIMKDGTEKQLAQLRLQTDQRKAALKGSVDQIAVQQQILEIQYIEQVQQIRQQANKKEIEQIESQAIEKITKITGTSEEIQKQRLVIEQETIEKVKTVFVNNIEEQTKLLQEQATKRKELIIGDSEVITTEMETQITESEQRLTEELSQLKINAEKQQVTAIKEIKTAISTDTKKQYESELKILESTHKQQQILITQAAIKRLEAGEDEKAVTKDLKEQLLTDEEKFLKDKQGLEVQFGLDGLATQEEIEKMKLDNTLNRIDKENEAEENARDERWKGIEKGLAITSNLIGDISTLNQSVLDADLAKIEANKKRELAAVGDNESAKRSIEEKYEKKKEAAEIKAAKRQKAISIAQTIINTAQSIIKTGAQLGYPLAIPFQVIAGAIGAAQIQAIRAQAFEQGGTTVLKNESGFFYDGMPLQQAGSFASGGHIKTGSIGVIGEKGPEWVAPNWMMTSPKYAPVLNQLEAIRVRGFAVGGETTPADTAVSIQNAAGSNQDILDELRMLREAVKAIQPVTVWSEKEALMNAEIYAAWQSRSSNGGV